MEGKGTIRRTIYAITSEEEPVRVIVSIRLMERINRFRLYLDKLKLNRNEHVVFSINNKKFTILVEKNGVDLGEHGFSGWHSFISYKNLLTLPNVFFSMEFKQLLLLEREEKWHIECSKIIRKKDLVFLVWDKVAGKA
jgi:hypothetical protein